MENRFLEDIFYRARHRQGIALCAECCDLAREIESVYKSSRNIPSPKLRRRIHKMYEHVAVDIGMATRRNAEHVIDTMLYDFSYPNWDILWVENEDVELKKIQMKKHDDWRDLWLDELTYFSDRWTYIRLCRSIYAYGQWMAEITNHDWLYILK